MNQVHEMLNTRLTNKSIVKYMQSADSKAYNTDLVYSSDVTVDKILTSVKLYPVKCMHYAMTLERCEFLS